MRRALPTPLVLLVVLLAACPPVAVAAPERILFPVLGGATSYTDDYGDARGQGAHQGNDLMAPRGRPVVAVADGVVKLHASPRSGPMLYLTSRTHEYLYIHLNNDRTAGNDNRGGTATAYAPGLRSGARVRAGQVIGYVGDSGDADGIAPHLHFEVHRRGGGPVNPYRLLRAAPVQFVAAPSATPASRRVALAAAPVTRLVLAGTLAWVAGDRLAIRARSVDCDVSTSRPLALRRLVVLRATPAAVGGLAGVPVGAAVRVTTGAALTTPAHRLLFPGTWTAETAGPAAR
jgi:hypothetical protein